MEKIAVPPATTAHGALINHITGGHIETTDKGTGSFQPMNVNFGLFPPVDAPKRIEGKRLDHTEKAAARKRAYTSRAKADFAAWARRSGGYCRRISQKRAEPRLVDVPYIK